MKRKSTRRAVSLLLAFMMVFAMIPQMAASGLRVGTIDNTAYADDTSEEAKELAEAAQTYVEALGHFVSDKKELSRLEISLERLSGTLSIVSGTIGVMQALGIIEDPTEAQLTKIYDAVMSITNKLDEMDQKLNQIINDLEAIKKAQATKARVDNARSGWNAWCDFATESSTASIAQLKEEMGVYTGFVEDEKKAWLREGPHEGLRVLYAHDDKNNEQIHVYSHNSYEEGIPEKSDAGETILKEACIGLPAKCMPDTGNIKYNVDTWRQDVTKSLTEAFKTAANDGNLDWSESSKANWQTLSDEKKNEMAASYANDLVDSLLHLLSCKAMAKHHGDFSARLYSKLERYCDLAVTQYKGLDALLQVRYNTNGLEGEAREIIENDCDFVIAMTGYYGSFALTALGQDDEFSIEKDLKPLQKKWASTIDTLSAIKDKAITKHDNFSYISGTLVDFRQLDTTSTVTLTYDYVDDGVARYRDEDSSPWKLTGGDPPPCLTDTEAAMLFDQFLVSNAADKGPKSYAEYLSRNKVSIPASFSDKITVAYHGPEVFALQDKPWLLSQKAIGHDFKDDKWYQINKTGYGDGYFRLHDKVTHDYIDAKTGKTAQNEILAARSYFTDSSMFYASDEMFAFESGGCSHKDKTIGRTTITYLGTTFAADIIERTFHYDAPTYFLTSAKVKEDTGQNSEVDPLRDIIRSGPDPEPEKQSPAYSGADWTKIDVNNLNLYNNRNDKRLDEGIRLTIDNTIKSAKSGGLDVSLTKKEKTELAKDMKDKLFEVQAELQRNSIVSSLNVLGIEGNDEKELELAMRTLQGTYLNGEGESLIPPENINTMVEYEPYVMLRFEEQNGKARPVLEPAFEVIPIVVIWDSDLKQFQTAPVHSDDMSEMGLTMHVKLPASFVRTETAEVILYDGDSSMDVLSREKNKVMGSDEAKYVEMDVAKGRLIELKAEGALAAKGKTVKIKSKKNRLTGTKKISAKKAYSITNTIGKPTFQKVKASKSSGKFKVDSKTGRITVKKGLKRGAYDLTVKVKDPGDDTYSPYAKNVVVKIKVVK